jgi:anti-sigma regulatory factor (Ser/Thr protein kinase)/GAF domain-containing protein
VKLERQAPTRRWTFSAVPEQVPLIRRAVSDFAREHGVSPETLADVQLAVSEAATNAVLHAFVEREPGTVTVVARASDGMLMVHVIDDGRGMQPRTDSPGLGLGLPTMGQLATRLDVRIPPDGLGTEVRMTFAAPGVRGPGLPEESLDEDRARLVAEVARLAVSTGWPQEGVASLVELLVPAVADICALDVTEAGTMRRLAGLVHRDGRRSRRLAELEPPRPGDDSPLAAALEAGEPWATRLSPELAAQLTGDADGAAWWIVAPLVTEDGLLGVLHCGLSADRGEPGADDLEFLALVAQRAGEGLARAGVVSELRRTRERLAHILDALAEAVTVNDEHGNVVYANAAAVDLLGAESLEELLIAPPGELARRFTITREDGSPVTGTDEFPGHRLMRGLSARPLLTRSVHRETGVDRWLLTKATLLEGPERLAVNIIEDLTEAKDAELRQRFLARMSDVLAGSLEYDQTLRSVADVVVPDLADWCVIDMVEPDGSLRRVAVAHKELDKLRIAEEIERRYPAHSPTSPGMLELLESRGSMLVEDLDDEMLEQDARDAEHLQMLREVGMRSVIAVVMATGERAYGILTLIMAESRRAFDASDQAFAEDVARRAAVALDTARRFSGRA